MLGNGYGVAGIRSPDDSIVRRRNACYPTKRIKIAGGPGSALTLGSKRIGRLESAAHGVVLGLDGNVVTAPFELSGFYGTAESVKDDLGLKRIEIIKCVQIAGGGDGVIHIVVNKSRLVFRRRG